MKSFLQFTFFVLCCMLFACQEGTGDQASGENAAAGETELPADAARRMADVNASPVNATMTDQLAGNWTSYTESGKQLQLLGGDAGGMKYTVVADGKVVDKGVWGSPTDCTVCNLTNSDICFYLDNGKERTCCTIVKMDNDTLQYFVVGAGGGMKGFVKSN